MQCFSRCSLNIIVGTLEKGQYASLEEWDSAGAVSRYRNEINLRNASSNRKNNKLKLTKEEEVDINDEVVDNESAVVGAVFLREKDLEEKILILINSLKNKECAVASVLSALTNSSKNLVHDSNYS